MRVVDVLTKRCGGCTAVDNADVRVEKGEIVGAIDPNGSGKSTIFKMLAGVLKTNGAPAYGAGGHAARPGTSTSGAGVG